MPWGESSVKHDIHAEGREVDIPRVDQRIQEGNAVFQRHVEDVRVQKLEDHDAHLLVASAARSSHRAEPFFAFQFLPGDPLYHVQKLLGDEALELTERLLLENRPYLLPSSRRALAQNQVSNFLKHGGRRVLEFLLQLLAALELGQLRKLAARQLEKLAHLLVEVGSIGRGGQFLPGQQLGDVGLGDLGGRRQVLLLQSQVFQPLPDDQANVHEASYD